jgi:sulfatase maturation enzyme AslB (radical SAM superfamily)
MVPADVNWLHVEASSRCNAWCPACPRNIQGFELADGLVEQDLDSVRFESIISQLPNLHGVQFCGNHGDPIIAKNILELINIAKKYSEKIQIHTNGSLRNSDWWGDLADLLQDINHDIWFGIDGLEGIHEIYRQATSFTKIIENASAFINKGGHATWQFIPFAHNEHQIKDCLKLSQKLKFKKFKLVKSYRNKNKARQFKTGTEFTLSAPNEDIRQVIRFVDKRVAVAEKDCMHLSMPSIYIDAAGSVSYCCHLSSIKPSGITKFDSLDELMYNQIKLNAPGCVASCGS